MSDATIIVGQLNDADLRRQIADLAQYVDDQFKGMGRLIDQALGGKGGTSASSDRSKKQVKEQEEINEAAKKTEETYDNIAKATDKAIASAKQYTDEIRKQAEAIRATKSWQEKGYALVGDVNYYDKERANVSRRDKAVLLSLEEQILQVQQRQEEEARKKAKAEQEEVVAQQTAMQAAQTRHRVEKEITDDVMRRSQKQNFASYSDFREALAHALQIDKKEVVLANEKTASYQRLSETLKQLQTAYNNLNAEERNSPQGKALVASIREVENGIRRIKQEAAAPVNLNSALGLSERSISDISYKMQQLRLYMNNLDWRKQAAEVRFCEQEYARLQARQNELLGQNAKLLNSNTTLARSWTYMKNRLAFYLTVGATTSFVKTLVEVRGQYEMTEKALGVLVDSAQRGTQIFNELSQMALISPYTLIELSNAARQLTAYGVAARDVVDTTRRLADVAAAVGAPIERIAYALGHVQSFGYLTSLQARQFANAGIPLVKELAKRYTELEGHIVSTSDVYDRMKHKQIEYADVMGVINSMTDEGGRFFNFQAKMAETLKVQLANLTLAWNNMLNDIGKSNQGLIEAPIKGLKVLFQNWQTVSRIITDVIVLLGALRAAQLLVNVTVGSNVVALKKKVLADKEVLATELRRKAMTQELTVAEQQLLLSTKRVTVADYENALAGKAMTRQQAMALVAFNKTNTALHTALINLGLLTNAELKAALASNRFVLAMRAIGAAISGVFKSIGSFIANNWLTVVLFAVTDLFFYFRQLSEKQKELNQNIANSAKETAESLRDSLKSLKQNMDVSTPDAALKTWEEISGEIENSSAAGQYFVAQLQKIPDVATRVSTAINWSEKIIEANNALEDLYNDLDLSEDTWFGGLFGEGLAEDLEDVGEDMKKVAESIANGVNTTLEKYEGRANVFGANAKEATREMRKFADEVQRVLELKFTPEQLANPVIVREALERIRQEVKLANPKIRGEAAKFFDIDFDLMMEERLGDVVDKNASIMRLITDEIKAKYSQAFADVADGSDKLSDEQIKTLNKVIEQISGPLPLSFKEAINEMVAHMNMQDWVIPIRVALSGGIDKSVLQLDMEKQFLGMGGGRGALSPETKQKFQQWIIKPTETLEQWNKRIGDKFNENLTTLEFQYGVMNSLVDKESARYTEASKTYNAAKSTNEVLKEMAAYEGITLTDTRKGKGGKKGGKTTKPEDEVAKALKEELSLIKEMQSNYDKLRKSGLDTTTALTLASSGYENTLRRINAVLKKYGIAEFKASDFVGRDAGDPNTLLAALMSQRDTLLKSGKVKTDSLKELDVEIQKLNIEAKTYNMSKITESLNNELGKIKDEYELGLELDADPELGGAFADMFGIDTQALPKSFKEMLARVQEAVGATLVSLGEKHGRQYSPFNVMTDSLESWAKGNEISTDNPLYKAMEGAQKSVRETFKKNLVETEKMLDNYVKKYGDYSDKVAEIEADRLDRIKKLNEAYYTDSMRQSADYQAKMDAIERGATREKGQLKWQDFKESDLYIKMFENLQYTSTGVLQTIRQKLQDLRNEMGAFNPEQVKQIAEQMEKIDSELIKRNPYKGLNKTIREGIKALKERKTVQQQYAKAESAYTEQRDNVAKLEQEIEAAKREGNEEDILQKEQALALAKQILETLGKQRNESALLNEKNRQALKDFAESFQAISNDFTNFANAGVEIRDTLAEVGVTFGDEINGAIDGMAQASQGFSELVSSAMSGNIFGVVAGGIKSLVGTGKTFASLFGGGKKDYFTGMKESVEEFASIIDKASSKILQTMETSTGAKAASQYKKLRDYNKSLEDSYRDLANAAGRSGSSWGSHSYAVRTNKRLSGEWERISGIVGQTVTRVEDLYRLSPEQLSDLLEMAPDAWGQIDRSIRESLEGIIDAGEKAVEYAEAFKEALTGVTFSGMKSDLESMLIDVDSTVEGAMEDMDEKVRRAAARQLLQGYDDRINKWVEEYNALWETDNVSDEALDAKIAEYETLMEELFKRRDAEFDRLGVGDEKKELSALQQGIQGITENQAGALEAYMNGVSQQVYYQSDILTQIRDSLIGFDMDIANGTRAQMLLQLQQSYQVQQAIQGILLGWSSPNGMAVRVEMI